VSTAGSVGQVGAVGRVEGVPKSWLGRQVCRRTGYFSVIACSLVSVRVISTGRFGAGTRSCTAVVQLPSQDRHYMNSNRFEPSRRRHPRIQVDGTVKGDDVTQGIRVRLCDVSEGGFQTEAAQLPTVGDRHNFRVLLKSGETCVLEAIAVHCRVVSWPTSSCLVGWRLTDETRGGPDIRALIEDVTTLAPGLVAGTTTEPVWAFQTKHEDATAGDRPVEGKRRE
jgi:hypothetical protein